MSCPYFLLNKPFYKINGGKQKCCGLHLSHFSLALYKIRSTKKLLVHSKYKTVFGTLIDCYFFQYCNRNIWLFLILLTFQICDAKFVALYFFVLLSLYSYRSFKYHNTSRSISVLKAIEKKRLNQNVQKMKQRG